MANIRVRAALERIGRDLNAVALQVQHYSGVNQQEAFAIDNMATVIAEQATAIAAEARARAGDRSAGRLVGKVRKALGFSYPTGLPPRRR